MTSPHQVLTLVACLVYLNACSATDPGDAETIRGPAILVHYGDTTAVTLPTSAHVGVPISITITSFGGGCIAQGETERTISGLEAEVRPYRYETVRFPPNTACTDELRIFRHTADLQFAEPGDARVRVSGLQRLGNASYTVVRNVIVLP